MFNVITSRGTLDTISPKAPATAEETIDILADFKCTVCDGFYEKTISSRDCKHIICISCYERLIKVTCPTCQNPLILGRLNEESIKSINNILPKCKTDKIETNDEIEMKAKKHNQLYEGSYTLRKINSEKHETQTEEQSSLGSPAVTSFINTLMFGSQLPRKFDSTIGDTRVSTSFIGRWETCVFHRNESEVVRVDYNRQEASQTHRAIVTGLQNNNSLSSSGISELVDYINRCLE